MNEHSGEWGEEEGEVVDKHSGGKEEGEEVDKHSGEKKRVRR